MNKKKCKTAVTFDIKCDNKKGGAKDGICVSLKVRQPQYKQEKKNLSIVYYPPRLVTQRAE